MSKNSNIDLKSFNSILKYLFIIFTIFQGKSIYFDHSKVIVTGIWEILLLLLCSRSLLLNNNKYNGKFYLIIIILSILLFSILIAYYLYYPFPFTYFFLFLINPVLLIIYFYNSFDIDLKYIYSLFYKFENVMFLLALISIVSYFLYCLGIKPAFSMNFHWAGGVSEAPSYLGLCFFPKEISIPKIAGITLPIRNCGIFPEAPIFAYFLSISFFINLFMRINRTRKDNLQLLIIFISIILTVSTNGIILSIVASIFKVLDSNINGLKKCMFSILIPISLIVVDIIFNSKKSIDLTNVNSSYNVRYDNIMASIHAWTHHLIIGNGINNNQSIYSYINPMRFITHGDIGITSNLFEVLAFGGILLSLLYIIPLFLSFYLQYYIRDMVIFSFIYFIFGGTMAYNIYYIILSFCVSDYIWNKLRDNHIGFSFLTNQ